MSIELLPGDSGDLRAAAAHLRTTAGELATAHRAATRVEAVTGGEHWRGEAFDAFRAAVEQRPVPAVVDRAASHMEEAAGRLDWLAARFDDNQQTLHWCRSRLAALAGADTSTPEAAAAVEAERQAVERDAAAAWADHRAGLASVADLFDWLDDQPFYATPPPSTLERVAGGVGSFVLGVGEGIVGLAEAVVLAASLLDPGTWVDAWNNRDQILAVLQYAWDHPVEFATELGRAVLDLDMLAEDPARWLGRRIPDIVLMLATAGLGGTGSAAATAVRGLRGAHVADRFTDAAGMGGRIGWSTLHGLESAHDALDLVPRQTIGGQFAAIGADAGRLTRAGDHGAFARTDSALGRLATRVDEGHPALAVARQVPGRLHDEIRGFTSIPLRTIRGQDPSALVSHLTGPTANRVLASSLTNGLTGQLGMLDGLLVGASALSPASQLSMVGVLGLSAADHLQAPVDAFRDLREAAGAH